MTLRAQLDQAVHRRGELGEAERHYGRFPDVFAEMERR